MYKQGKGFTLAEILLTLLIIGVIASIVVPAVINDTNEAEYNTGVKKAFAELSNAIKMVQTNNGGFVNVGTSTSSHLGLRNDFCNVMECVKKDTTLNIWGPANYKYYKGGYIGYPGSTYTDPSVVLNNGNFLRFIAYSDCDQYDIHACGFIWVDINGKKGPNMAGKDFHFFWIVRQNGNGIYSIVPFGIQGDSNTNPLPDGCTPGSSIWGRNRGCTAQRLIDPEHMP